MPARDFRVYFANSTPYVLQRTSDNSVQGAWTPPDSWQPPTQIQPHQTIGWQSESNGVLTGTEGTAIYEIQDSDGFFGTDSHIGHQDQVVIHWDNPWWGPPHSDGHFQVISNAPTNSDSSSTFGGGYAAGHSTDYILVGSGAPSHGDPINIDGGAHPQGDFPGPISTDGWAQIIPGLIALPIPDGSIAHTWSVFSLQVKDVVVPTPAFNSAPTLTLHPEVTASGDSWNAVWGDTSQTSSTRLLVTITGQAMPTTTSPHVPNQGMFHKQEAVRASTQQTATAKGELMIHVSPSSQSEVPIALLPGYTVDITYKGSSRHIHEEQLTSSLTRVSSYKGDVFAGLQFSPVQKLGQNPTPSGVMHTQGNEQIVHASAGAAKEIASAQVLTIVLSQNVSLQLYGEYDEQTKQRVDYRVRYIESANDGSTIMDVMLLHSYQPPR